MKPKPRMMLAIRLFVKHTGNKWGFVEAAQNAGFTYAGACTYWHILHKTPTPSQQTYIRLERKVWAGVLAA